MRRFSQLSTLRPAAGGAALTLYQYEICPFCNKVKALLDLLAVPYTTVEVNPMSKGELKPWSVDVNGSLGDDVTAPYIRVPVLTTGDGEPQTNDSAAIVARIANDLWRDGDDRSLLRAVPAPPSFTAGSALAEVLTAARGALDPEAVDEFMAARRQLRSTTESERCAGLSQLRAIFAAADGSELAKFGDRFRAAADSVEHGVLAHTHGDASTDPSVAANLAWSQWADNQIAMLMFPVITRSPSDSWKAFSYAGGVQAATWGTKDRVLNRIGGAFFMWLAQGKIKKKYAVEDEQAELRAALRQWSDDGLAGSVAGAGTNAGASVGDEGGPFAGAGATPSLADVAVFGSIRAIDGLPAHDALFRAPLDAAREPSEEDDVEASSFVRLREWYVAMEREVGTSAAVGGASPWQKRVDDRRK